MGPFANVEDYIARYGLPDGIERSEVHACLMDATDLMCAEMDNADIQYAGVGEPFTGRLRRVCRAIAHRALGDGRNDDIPFGAKELKEGAEQFSSTVSLANPYGDLFMTDAERKSLGIGIGRACVTSPYG